ncbi:MAG: restriction endonuclease subunit S, partial [Collinsella sp.]|nr:restriction endonuclease subunit S [Collinsella sp.]
RPGRCSSPASSLRTGSRRHRISTVFQIPGRRADSLRIGRYTNFLDITSGIILGGDLNVVTPTGKLDPDYTALAITYSKAHDDLAKRAQGKSVVHVHGNDIAEVEISYPSESEQKRISSVVLNLDSLITLHQREPRFADTG